MTKKKFIDKIKPFAVKAYKTFAILPSLTIAQAICESAWGRKAPGNMLFGMKWTPNCGYDFQELWTSEFVNGEYIKVKVKFRKYNSWEESILDHSNLLQKPRYRPVLKSKNYLEATKQIKLCGYATSPTYTQTLRKIIEQYKLYKEDWKMDFNKKIADNFKWGEFWSNSVKGIKIEPPEELYLSIATMAIQLQKVRDIINKPIIITSGYRTPKWNKIVKGAKNSYHMKGMAVDSRPIGMDIREYICYLLRYTSFNGFGIYTYSNFIHSDLRPNFTIFRVM